jgi:RNA polymerase sigma factor (sigma-70 family)
MRHRVNLEPGAEGGGAWDATRGGMTEGELAERLEAMAGLLHSVTRQEAGPALLRFESVEDLVQGTAQEALRSAGQLEWRGEEAFKSWVITIAKRHVMGRRDYWFAMKRNPGALLRLTLTGSAGNRVERPELAAEQAGPSTFAFRREQLVLITKAMGLLMTRDRELVSWASNGLSTAEMAARLGISEEATEKARTRALERLRKAFRLVSQGRGGEGR